MLSSIIHPNIVIEKSFLKGILISIFYSVMIVLSYNKGTEGFIMQSDASTLYKLIILFILDKVDFSLTNAQISNFILEKEYTNYFNIQQAFSELIEAELILAKTIRNSSYYKLTDTGRETLEFFNEEISDAIKTDIVEYLKANRYALREEVSSLSDFYKAKKNEYIAHCLVTENDSKIIELSLNVTTEEEATLICNNWREKSQEIYAFLMKTLMN